MATEGWKNTDPERTEAIAPEDISENVELKEVRYRFDPGGSQRLAEVYGIILRAAGEQEDDGDE